MAIEITIPRLGWNMEEGVFVGWLKQDGDTVRAGECVFSLEGEKATEDVECLDSGILRIPPTAPKPGDKVAVGTVIAYLVRQGESVAGLVGLEDSAHPTPASTTSAMPASPSVRRLARQLGLNLQA